MPEYLFKDKHVGFSDEGIHLLRNGYNYQTLRFGDVSQAIMKRGNALKNRVLLLTIGLAAIGISTYLVAGLISTINSDETHIIYIESFLIPLFPFLIGVYSVFVTLKSETIMEVQTDKKHKVSLKSFEKDMQLEAVKNFLSGKIKIHGAFD